jgi:hypothetical protein
MAKTTSSPLGSGIGEAEAMVKRVNGNKADRRRERVFMLMAKRLFASNDRKATGKLAASGSLSSGSGERLATGSMRWWLRKWCGRDERTCSGWGRF